MKEIHERIYAETKAQEMRFKKRPVIICTNCKRPFAETLYRNGKVKSSKIVIPKRFKRYRKLYAVVLAHEKNEVLYQQNVKDGRLLHNRFSHGYALTQEKKHLREAHLSKNRYIELTRKLGFVP